MKIRIIKVSDNNKWYKDKIGHEYETYGDAFLYPKHGGNNVYFIRNVDGTKFVLESDAEVIDPTEWETRGGEKIKWATVIV